MNCCVGRKTTEFRFLPPPPPPLLHHLLLCNFYLFVGDFVNSFQPEQCAPGGRKATEKTKSRMRRVWMEQFLPDYKIYAHGGGGRGERKRCARSSPSVNSSSPFPEQRRTACASDSSTYNTHTDTRQ